MSDEECIAVSLETLVVAGCESMGLSPRLWLLGLSLIRRQSEGWDQIVLCCRDKRSLESGYDDTGNDWLADQIRELVLDYDDRPRILLFPSPEE